MDKELQELYEEHCELRQERLMYYNLIATAQDEINLLKRLQAGTRQKRPSEETKEFFKELLGNCEKSVEFSIESLALQTELIKKKEAGLDCLLYVVELEQVVLETVKNCRFMLDAVRAVKLTYTQ